MTLKCMSRTFFVSYHILMNCKIYETDRKYELFTYKSYFSMRSNKEEITMLDPIARIH